MPCDDLAIVKKLLLKPEGWKENITKCTIISVKPKTYLQTEFESRTLMPNVHEDVHEVIITEKRRHIELGNNWASLYGREMP